MPALPNLPFQLPDDLTSWTRITLGESGDEVYRLDGPGCERAFLKVSQRCPGEGLEPEASRLGWLGGKLSVPRVLAFGQDAERDYLLMTAVPGENATEQKHGADVPELVVSLAQGLRQVHSLSVDGCPFDHRLDAELARARERVEKGLVREFDSDDTRRGPPARARLQDVLSKRPDGEDLVFTHGDYCLPNVMIDQGRVAGFVDLGSAGVGDRYRDLSAAAWSLGYNWGERWVPLFFEAYGLEHVDEAKLRYYRMLDAFF